MKKLFFVIFCSRMLTAQAPISFDSEYPFLLKVLTTITTNQDFKIKKNIDNNQYIRYQISCSVYEKRSTLMTNMGRVRLQNMHQFLESQTPPEPSRLQLPLIPLKYLNAFGHVLDNMRPYLEKCDEQIAKQYAQLENNSKDLKAFVTVSETLAVQGPNSVLLNAKYAIDQNMHDTKKESEDVNNACGITGKKKSNAPRINRNHIPDETLWDKWTTSAADAINNFFKK